MRSKKSILLIASIVIILLFSFKKYLDYQEKNLGDINSLDLEKIEGMTFKLDGFEEWRTDDKKLIEEMLSFLENYEVKKIQNRDWDSDVSKETSFRVEFYEKERITHMVIHEDRMNVMGKTSGYYKILNGPIDLEWIESFQKKQP